MRKFFNSSLIKGTLILTLFGFLGKALGAVFKIGLSSLVGSLGMGIYQLVFPLLVFFIVLSSEGFCLTLTIRIAEDKQGIKHKAYFKFATLLTFFFSIISGVIIVLFTNFLSSIQGGRVEPYLYFVIAIGVIIISLLSIIKAQIRGKENFKLYSSAEVVEDLLKVIFGLVLGYVLLPLGVMPAVAGVILGIITSSFVTILILLIFDKKNKNKLKVIPMPLSKEEKASFLKFSLLGLGSAIIVPAVQFIESAIIIDLLSKAGASAETATRLFGLSRGSVSAVLNLPFFVLTSFEVLLLPNLARSKVAGIYYKKTGASLFLAIFISLPFMLLFSLFSIEVVQVLYGGALTREELIISAQLLKLGSVGIVFSALSTILSVILNSNNKVFAPFLASSFAGVVKIIFLIIFVPRMSIYGAEISSIIFSMVLCLINLIFAFKYKIFSSPKNVVPCVLGWGLVFSVVWVLFNQLKKVILNNLVSCAVSFLIVGFIIGLVALVSFLLNRKKFVEGVKKLLGL